MSVSSRFLQGQKFKTRTRDKKVKYDPEGFSEAIITKINESQGDIDQIATNLDKEGEKHPSIGHRLDTRYMNSFKAL